MYLVHLATDKCHTKAAVDAVVRGLPTSSAAGSCASLSAVSRTFPLVTGAWRLETQPPFFVSVLHCLIWWYAMGCTFGYHLPNLGGAGGTLGTWQLLFTLYTSFLETLELHKSDPSLERLNYDRGARADGWRDTVRGLHPHRRVHAIAFCNATCPCFGIFVSLALVPRKLGAQVFKLERRHEREPGLVHGGGHGGARHSTEVLGLRLPLGATRRVCGERTVQRLAGMRSAEAVAHVEVRCSVISGSDSDS